MAPRRKLLTLNEWIEQNHSAEVREATIERCAKIAKPWQGYWLDRNSTDVARAVVEVRTEIAKAIRALTRARP